MVVPDHISVDFLKSFIGILDKHTRLGKKFYIIVGGGKTARVYQQALKDLGAEGSDTLDWVGIYATHLNAELVRLACGDLAHDAVIKDPYTIPETHTPVIVYGGWKPGRSTDFAPVILAESTGAGTVINLSNIAYVYDSDPRHNPHAQKFETITWPAYRALIPAEWTPGMSAPFDPTASLQAQELGVTVAVLHGADLENLDRYLSGQDFEGTTIVPE